MKNTIVTEDRGAPEGFRRVLQAELSRRCNRNGQYSLRAFARDLETDHASLSQVLRGRRRATEPTVRRLGKRLGLEPERIEGLVALEKHGSASEGRELATLEYIRDLTEDALEVQSRVEHAALLELTHLEGFRPDVRWIARVLGLEVEEVQVALQRLIRLGMLDMVSKDIWLDRSGSRTTVLGSRAFETVRRLADRVRRRGPGSEPPPDEREFSTSTLAVDAARIPEALDRIARFRRDLIRFLEGGGERTAVVHLELSFQTMTRIDEGDS